MKLEVLSNGRRLVRTGYWLSLGDNGEIVTSLDEPKTSPREFVGDLKRFALQSPEPGPRTYTLRGPERTVRKDIGVGEAIAEFLRLLNEAVPIRDAEPLSILVPALDPLSVKTFRAHLTEALPGVDVDFRSEPDMAFEYFRLATQQVHIEANAHHCVLVVDAGAQTFNATLVFTTTSGDVGDATRRNRGALQAVEGEALPIAGRTVDERIMRAIADALGDEYTQLSAYDQIKIAERLKIDVSKSRESRTVESPNGRRATLSAANLGAVSKLYWSQYYGPLLTKLLGNAFDQLNSYASGREILKSRSVESHEQMSKMLSAAILCGGTSRLPEFELRFRKWLPDECRLVAADREYTGVNALGGMAHVLHVQRKLITAAPALRLVPSLPGNVYLCAQVGTGPVKSLTVVHRNSWDHVDSTPREFFKGKVGGKARFWLAWDQNGRRMIEPPEERTIDFGALAAPVVVSASRDEHDYFVVQVSYGNTSEVLLGDFSGSVEMLPVPPADVDVPELGYVAFRGTDGVVVDFGMSKTLVATCAAPGKRKVSALQAEATEEAPNHRMEPGWEITHAPAEASLPDSKVLNPEGKKAPPLEATRLVPDGSPEGIPPPIVEVSIAAAGDKSSEASEVPPGGPAPDGVASPKDPGEPTDIPSLKGPSGTAQPEPIRETAFTSSWPQLLASAGYDIEPDDITFLHLALKTRPFVLLAGRPGIGKTAIAHAYANLLGCGTGSGQMVCSHVAAHWIKPGHMHRAGDTELAALLENPVDGRAPMRFWLLDEFNLSRPEFYFSHFLGGLESPERVVRIDSKSSVKWGPSSGLLVVGTLNVDEHSRPPSEKVIDRAFVIERTPPSDATKLRRQPQPLAVTQRITVDHWTQWLVARSTPEPHALGSLDEIQKLFLEPSIRDSGIFVSARAWSDVASLMEYAFALDPAPDFCNRMLDRAICARVLPTMRTMGSAGNKAVEHLMESLAAHGLERAKRRVTEIGRVGKLTHLYSFWV